MLEQTATLDLPTYASLWAPLVLLPPSHVVEVQTVPRFVPQPAPLATPASSSVALHSLAPADLHCLLALVYVFCLYDLHFLLVGLDDAHTDEEDDDADALIFHFNAAHELFDITFIGEA